MHIVELRASNFARLRAVAIRPDGSLIRVTGKNSAGKSSVLKAIWTALAGRAAAPPRPIYDGAEKAVINLNLGPLAITRTFAHGKHGEVTSSLTITDESGAPVRKSPQALIDELLGDLSFDPLAFARLAPKEQFAKLRALVPGVDFDGIARERQRLYDARTAANRMEQAARARVAGVLLPPGREPEPVDVETLVGELANAHEVNRARASWLAQVQRLQDDAERMLNEAEALRAKEAGLEQGANKLLAQSDDLLRNMPAADVDTGPITAKLAAAKATNDARRAFELKREREQEMLDAEAESERLTAAMLQIDRTVKTAIANAKLPGGLSLEPGEGVVHLGGRPFAAAGTAAKIVASAEVAMALNPELRVMLIDEGSELDNEHLELLATLAERRDYQIWIARVEEGEDTGIGFRIVDGEVAPAQPTAVVKARG